MTAKGIVRVLASPRDTLLVLRLAVMLCLVVVLARILALSTLLKLLTPKVNGSKPACHDIGKITRYTESLMRLCPLFSGSPCLHRSLVLYRLLNAVGYPVMIHFGVNRKPGRLSGHSWLTFEGKPVAERTDPSKEFAVVHSFPK